MTLAELKASIHDFLGQNVTRYRPVAFLHPTIRRRWVDNDTYLVIDGYPRCANTFAYHGFLEAHDINVVCSSETKVAHHIHQPAQIIKGANMGVPTLVLVRNPKDCVSSLIVRNPKFSIKYALKRYVKFYKKIKKVEGKVTIGRFEQVTKKYGKVIDKLNKKFGVDFKVPRHTKEFENRVFERIDWVNEKMGDGREREVSRPSKGKKVHKKRCTKKVKSNEIMYEAEKIYKSLIKN